MASTTADLEPKDNPTPTFTANEINFEYSFPWPVSWLFKPYYRLIGAPYAPFKYEVPLFYQTVPVRPNREHMPLQAKYSGLGSPDLMTQVDYYWKQAKRSKRQATFFVPVIMFALTFALYSPYFSAWGPMRFAALVFLYLPAAAVTQRVFYVLFGKHYAPSLCANSVVMVNFFLLSDDVMTKPEVKKKLLVHLRDLARKTLLLPLCYRSTDAATQRKMLRHFKEMESYVRERERQAILPTNTTLEDLRRDFKELAAIYLTGQYGRFKWRDAGAPEPAPQESRWKAVPAAVLRFAGFVLPLGLMGAYLWQPEFFPVVEVDKKVVVLIFIAWLLLALDVGLKLGVVGELAGLAKGIRDLKP